MVKLHFQNLISIELSEDVSSGFRLALVFCYGTQDFSVSAVSAQVSYALLGEIHEFCCTRSDL